MKLFLIVALTVLSSIRLQAGPVNRLWTPLLRSRNTDSFCLNGGTYLRGRQSCLCPTGFSGKYCEIDTSTCYHNNGHWYRGTASVSETGRRCLNWNMFERRPEAQQLLLGLGKHNYCRNPDRSTRPWCRTKNGGRVVREFCAIRSCGSESMSSCGQRSQTKFKIVGGALTSAESQPWVASIFSKSHSRDVFRCGGSLISSCWVLTAAHCFPDGPNTDVAQYSVFLGKNAINETSPGKEQKFHVEKVIVHEAFDEHRPYNNDIALVKIAGHGGQCAMETSSVRTVCLPPPSQMLPPGTRCQVAGYGKEDDRSPFYSQYLRETTVDLMSQHTCTNKIHYGDMVTDNMFCAASPTWTTDACEGDSGGPLVCEVETHMFLFGIVSWGEGCSQKFRPGVYTRVTNYNSWIEKNTGLADIALGLMYPEK